MLHIRHRARDLVDLGPFGLHHVCKQAFADNGRTKEEIQKQKGENVQTFAAVARASHERHSYHMVHLAGLLGKSSCCDHRR
jgi:hypothetical protein